MFSTITEAWNNNPVNEITTKLTNGSFQDKDSYASIYDFKQKQHTNHRKCTTDLINLSDTSLNLLSENSVDTDRSTYSPIKLSKTKSKSKSNSNSGLHTRSIDFSEFETDDTGTDTNTDTDTDSTNLSNIAMRDSRCTYSVRHLSKCKKCSRQLNRLINKKVHAQIDDILLNDKLNQVKKINMSKQADLDLTPTQISGLSETWKETLIIVVGAIIAIFIIYLATRSFYR